MWHPHTHQTYRGTLYVVRSSFWNDVISPSSWNWSTEVTSRMPQAYGRRNGWAEMFFLSSNNILPFLIIWQTRYILDDCTSLVPRSCVCECVCVCVCVRVCVCVWRGGGWNRTFLFHVMAINCEIANPLTCMQLFKFHNFSLEGPISII